MSCSKSKSQGQQQQGLVNVFDIIFVIIVIDVLHFISPSIEESQVKETEAGEILRTYCGLNPERHARCNTSTGAIIVSIVVNIGDILEKFFEKCIPSQYHHGTVTSTTWCILTFACSDLLKMFLAEQQKLVQTLSAQFDEKIEKALKGTHNRQPTQPEPPEVKPQPPQPPPPVPEDETAAAQEPSKLRQVMFKMIPKFE